MNSICDTDRRYNQYFCVQRSETTQTEKLSTLDSLKLLLLSENVIINEESKNIYTLILSFMNNFHDLINEKLANHLDEHVKIFKIPPIPNYALLNDFAKERSSIEADNHSENVSEQSKTQVYKSISRKTLTPHRMLGKRNELQCKESAQQINLRVDENNLTEQVKEIKNSVELKNNLRKNDNIHECSSVMSNKCEKRCIILSKYHDEVHIKTNFNQITEQQNVTFQHSNEDHSAKAIKDSGDHSKVHEKRRRLIMSNFNTINIEPQPETTANSCKYIFEEYKTKNSIIGEHSKEHSISSGDLRSNSAESSTSLFNGNKICKVRPNTPSKVLDMFEKISPQNTLAKHLSVLNDFSQTNGSIEMANSVKDSLTFSDSDSDILDDENFEILNQDRHQKKSLSVIYDNRRENIPGPSETKGHPLQLTGKDLSNLNQKMINAIGLFTDSGDIKPAVRNILEQQKQNRYGAERKKQLFRNRRH